MTLLVQAMTCAPLVGQTDTVPEIRARVVSLKRSIAALRMLGHQAPTDRIEREP